MAEILPCEIPAPLRRLIDDGVSGAGAELAFQLVTVGSDGWPHVSMLSVGEIVTIDAKRLRLALWPRSHAALNCSTNGRAILVMVVDAVGYWLRLRLDPTQAIESREYGSLSTFAAEVVEARADLAPYARLETGIRFQLLDPEPVLSRWTRTRELLDSLGDVG